MYPPTTTIRTLFAASLLLYMGCTGGLRIDRYAKFSGSKDAPLMVSIDPEFDLNPLLQHSSDLYQRVSLRVAKSNRDFNDLLARNARKNGIKLQVIDSRTLSNMDEDFFNYLALSAQACQVRQGWRRALQYYFGVYQERSGKRSR